MRALPALGQFDLVTCLDDALNHLLTEAELLAALSGVRRNLAPGGVAVWDVNTLAAYGGMFAETHVIASGDTFVVWEGKAGRSRLACMRRSRSTSSTSSPAATGLAR
jgi:hypothetical protein